MYLPQNYCSTLASHVYGLDSMLDAICGVRSGLKHCDAPAWHRNDELWVAAPQQAPTEGKSGVGKQAEGDDGSVEAAAVVEVGRYSLRAVVVDVHGARVHEVLRENPGSYEGPHHTVLHERGHGGNVRPHASGNF